MKFNQQWKLTVFILKFYLNFNYIYLLELKLEITLWPNKTIPYKLNDKLGNLNFDLFFFLFKF